ncbi:MAG: hypothetical protein AAB393_19670 [Bacteroidota bacterium]
MILRYTLGWVVLLMGAIINGVIRETAYKENLGELAAHQVSTLTGIILFGVIIWGMTRLWPIQSSKQAWAIGLIWLALTLCFEFLFFHFVGGKPWSLLLHDYNVLEGRVWVLVLLWVLAAPYLFWRMQK